MSSDAIDVSPDQQLIHRFLASQRDAMPIDSNPLARALRSELRAIDAERQRIEIAFDPDALFVQGTGVLQGGALSAMLDFAMAFIVLARIPLGVSCATVTMTTTFQSAALRGRYLAIGELERCGKRLAFARSYLSAFDEPEKIVATASSTLVLAPWNSALESTAQSTQRL